jgi:hypothetical protein
VISHVGFVKLMRLAWRSVFSLHDPTRGAIAAEDQAEFFICAFDSEMFDIATSQATAANEAIARQTRPAYFDGERPQAAVQTQSTPDHIRVADSEAMRIFGRDLYRGAGAISFTGGSRKQPEQPFAGSLSNQIIRAAQCKILGDISSPGSARARFSFGQLVRPCLIEFAHCNLRELNLAVD